MGDRTMTITPGQNYCRPTLEVEHFLLTPAKAEANKWASFCPACREGILSVARSSKTFELQEFDRCHLCAQRVRYLDIATMRNKDMGI